jgi:hypothetical protein
VNPRIGDSTREELVLDGELVFDMDLKRPRSMSDKELAVTAEAFRTLALACERELGQDTREYIVENDVELSFHQDSAPQDSDEWR